MRGGREGTPRPGEMLRAPVGAGEPLPATVLVSKVQR
jgi:hypothetical protein